MQLLQTLLQRQHKAVVLLYQILMTFQCSLEQMDKYLQSGGITYTTGTLTAQPNDTVHFRVLSPNTFSSTLATSLNIGSITNFGTIRTRDAADITPSGFNLGPNTVTGTQPGLQYNAPMTATGSWTPINKLKLYIQELKEV